MKVADIKPLGRLKIVSSQKDADEVIQMLADGDSVKLVCNYCKNSRFTVEAVTRSVMTIVAGQENVIVLDREDQEIHVVKVLKCAICTTRFFGTKNKT